MHLGNKTSNLSKAHETHDSLSSSCSQIVLVHFQPFRCNSPLSLHCNRKSQQNTKTPYFGGSRSFKVIGVDKTKNPMTSACYDKQHVCTYLQPLSQQKSQWHHNNVF